LIRKNALKPELIPIDQFPFGIGMIEEMTLDEFGTATLTLSPGDLLFIGTDGITEAARQGRYTNGTFGESGLSEFLLAHRATALAELSDTLIETLKRFTNNTFHDDITFIAARALEDS
ncbi:hypothetical protein EBR57_06430, partial [bacterium]|nr:hypothetical protein [bacterium]